MVEDAKRTEQKAKVTKTVSVCLKMVIGALFLSLGIWTIFIWRNELFLVIRGCIGLFLILSAIVIFAIAKE